MNANPDQDLYEARAWNWKTWPDDKGRFDTRSQKPSAAACTRFTPTGPSARVKAKRAAKAARRRR